MTPIRFDQTSMHGALEVLYQLALETKELTMALQDQVAALTAEVAASNAAVAALAAAVDAEQVQVAAAIALLTADNPEIAAAIVALQEGAAAIAAVKADVESTIPDAPPAEEPPVA